MPHNFTSLKDVIQAYGLSYQTDQFIDFQAIEAVSVADWFKAEIDFSLKNQGQDDKEAFVSEFVIVPFLKEAWKHHANLSLFSHPTLTTDDVTVIPDYLLTARDPSGYKSIYKPLLITVEAKNENFDEGWMQAVLQAVVCQKLNEKPEIPIYAIVTTGDIWEFGKLENKRFTYHPLPLSVQDIGRLLGVLDFLYQQSEISAQAFSIQTAEA
jgi:hypothetical protein